MDTPTPTAAGGIPAHEPARPVGAFTPTPGSRLRWEPRNATSYRGFLPHDPHNTLFILELRERGRVQLLGAFIPDEEEARLRPYDEAKTAAETYLAEWVRRYHENTQALPQAGRNETL